MWHFSILAVLALVSLNPSFHGRNSCEGYDLPGVSFALTPDHGAFDRTAAVHFSDGSSVAVAKIEGSSAYKAFMREQNVTITQQTGSHHSLLHLAGSYLTELNAKLWKHSEHLSRIETVPIKPMLQTLKAAVESYLGNYICFVNLSLTKGERQSDYQINAFNKAIHQVGLTNVWEHTFDPSIPAMISNRLDNHSEPEKLILVVDNSRYGFNLGIFFRDDALFQTIRHNYKLLDSQVRSPERSLILQHAIKSIIKPSFGSLPITGHLPIHIGELVLYGDDIWDPDFRQTLNLVLDAELISRVHDDQPVFSTALGLAKLTFGQINDPMSRANRKAQFGCCWRSEGKGCPISWS
ncbi:heat shock 70 [Fusarium longipes]|uniref:Heat shock 70 n=1 Tax=Fusarium longipes TaxID=694270 RepID=A0A395TBM6_9HYPO|nr:heat shock 70 [Fusarium longipes]